MTERVIDREDQRIAALHAYNVLDTPPEESFDRITRLVRLTLGVPPVTFAGQNIPVTVSFGVTMWRDVDGDIGPAMKRADAALYQAKEAGRNRVVSVESPLKVVSTVAAA